MGSVYRPQCIGLGVSASVYRRRCIGVGVSASVYWPRCIGLGASASARRSRRVGFGVPASACEPQRVGRRASGVGRRALRVARCALELRSFGASEEASGLHPHTNRHAPLAASHTLHNAALLRAQIVARGNAVFRWPPAPGSGARRQHQFPSSNGKQDQGPRCKLKRYCLWNRFHKPEGYILKRDLRLFDQATFAPGAGCI